MFSRIISPRLNFLGKLKGDLDATIEREINTWLSENPNVKIHQLKKTMCGGSWAPGKLIVTMLYES